MASVPPEVDQNSIGQVLSAPAPPGAAEYVQEMQGPPPQPLPKGTSEEAPSSTIWQVVSTAVSTAVQSSLASKGYISPGQLSTQNLSDVILNTRKRALINRILYSGLDNKPILNMVDAVLVSLGVDPNRVPVTDKLEVFTKSYPSFAGLVYFLLGDEKYDMLFGKSGSPMLLAKGILEAYGPSRIDGPSAVNLANSLSMVFQANPALTKGFNSSELADVLQHAVKSGMLSATTDANVFMRQVMNVLPVYSSVRDLLKKELNRAPTKEELAQAVPKVLEQYSGMPFERIARQIRKDVYIRSLAPGGMFQAGMQAAGVQVPIAPDIYTKDDLTLRQNIIDSPVGNLAGATARAVQVYGKRGPLGQLYDAMLQGGMPFLTPGQWIAAAVRSGIPAPVAMTLIQQHERNKSFLTPELIQGVRAAQFKFDIAPAIDQINMMYRDPELRAGALAEYAKKLGYRNIGNIDAGTYMMLLHSNAIHSGVKKVLQEADYFAKLDEDTAHKRGLSFKNITQYALDVKHKKDMGLPVKFDLAGLLGAVKPEEHGIPRSFVVPPAVDISGLSPSGLGGKNG